MTDVYDRERINGFLRWLEAQQDTGATVVRIDTARQYFGGYWTPPVPPPVDDRVAAELEQARRWLRAVSAGRATREVHAEISCYLADLAGKGWAA